MKDLMLKFSYGFAYILATIWAWILLQGLHIASIFDKSGEARKEYLIAKYKFHHL